MQQWVALLRFCPLVVSVGAMGVASSACKVWVLVQKFSHNQPLGLHMYEGSGEAFVGQLQTKMENCKGKPMSVTADEFGQVLHKWQEENAMPWGRLRYHSAWRNIARHVKDRPLRILDIGGGDGMDAIHYARLGHRVTLSDCSPTMLLEAKKSAQEQGVMERLRLLQTSPEAVPDLFHEQPFDLILCHMMIEFVPDAPSFLRDACRLLCTDGLFSVLDTNRYSDVYMQAFQMKNLPAALDAAGAKEYFHPWVNRLTPRFSAAELIDQLTQNNCSLVGHYGVLNVCAYLPNEPKFDPQYYSELVRLEDSLADRYPYYLLARFFHVIVRKN